MYDSCVLKTLYNILPYLEFIAMFMQIWLECRYWTVLRWMWQVQAPNCPLLFISCTTSPVLYEFTILFCPQSGFPSWVLMKIQSFLTVLHKWKQIERNKIKTILLTSLNVRKRYWSRFLLSHNICWLLQQSHKTRGASWDKNGNRYNSEAAPQNVASRRGKAESPRRRTSARAPDKEASFYDEHLFWCHIVISHEIYGFNIVFVEFAWQNLFVLSCWIVNIVIWTIAIVWAVSQTKVVHRWGQ